MKPFQLIPGFVVSAFVIVISFITNKLGISFPALKLKKHAMGAVCVTSVGMLDFEDATAPFTRKPFVTQPSQIAQCSAL